MKRLHPNSIWLFFIQYVLFWVIIIFFSLFCFIPFFIDYFSENATLAGLGSFAFLILLLLCPFVVLVGLSYVFAKLTYANYKYELKENGFYKESGVITKKYVTIPYERIQNIDIYRGVLARILDLSDLHIQTAGMSSFGKYGTYSGATEGRLPGLSKEDAVQIRDELVKRAKGAKENSGL